MRKTQFVGLEKNIELKEGKLKNREVNIIESQYDWLINYIPEPRRKIAGDFKEKNGKYF